MPSNHRKHVWLAAAVLAFTMTSASPSSAASHCDTRVEIPASPSPLAAIRLSCPELAAILEEFAMRDLGEAFPDEGPHKPRHALASLGPVTEDIPSFARRASLDFHGRESH
jgi:hypothetical protein